MNLRVMTKAERRADAIHVLRTMSAPMQRLVVHVGAARNGMAKQEAPLATRRALIRRGLLDFTGECNEAVILTPAGYDVLRELRRWRRAQAKRLQAELQGAVAC